MTNELREMIMSLKSVISAIADAEATSEQYGIRLPILNELNQLKEKIENDISKLRNNH